MVKKTPASQHIAAKMDCCRDEHKQIKTDQDQKLFPSEFFKIPVTYPVPRSTGTRYSKV